ncbi:RsmD family RNA methyltransferase [Kocuria rhizophila]|nr:RsmD family RNA methyltransferase [Kocuria rhizophila]
MAATTDGFELAEADLKLRKEGRPGASRVRRSFRAGGALRREALVARPERHRRPSSGKSPGWGPPRAAGGVEHAGTRTSSSISGAGGTASLPATPGTRLKSVPGWATRPTTDRVKESLFGRLDAWGVCEDAHVLDLFASSGHLGWRPPAGRGHGHARWRRREPRPGVPETRALLAASCPGAKITTVHAGVARLCRAGFLPPLRTWSGGPALSAGEQGAVARMLSLLVGRLGPGRVITRSNARARRGTGVAERGCAVSDQRTR